MKNWDGQKVHSGFFFLHDSVKNLNELFGPPNTMGNPRTSSQFSSVAQSCLTLCDPMSDSAQPGLPVHHQLPEPTQTRVHWVGDAIQPSQPLLTPSTQTFQASGSFPVSQFFASGGQSIGAPASTSSRFQILLSLPPLCSSKSVSLQNQNQSPRAVIPFLA